MAPIVASRDYGPLLATGIPNWFTHWKTILGMLEARQPRLVLEVGSWMGSSAIPISRLIKEWGGVLTCVDHWRGSPAWEGQPMTPMKARKTFAANLRAHGVDNVQVLYGESPLIAAKVPVHSQDFIFIDACHDYEAVKADLLVWWSRLAPGGVMAGDDYGDPERYPGVIQAWDEFDLAWPQYTAGKGSPGVPWVERPR